jgi:cysteinyl-tRNA synthetase
MIGPLETRNTADEILLASPTTRPSFLGKNRFLQQNRFSQLRGSCYATPPQSGEKSRLGLGLADAEAPDADHSDTDPRIDNLVAQRSAARRVKDYETADRIRDQLAAENIELADSANGTIWWRTA